MPITKPLSSLSNAKQQTGADSPQNPGSLVTYTYGPVTSSAGQTVITLSFAVSTTNTANFFLWIDGKLMSGSGNDYSFTNVQANGTSSQITLNQVLPAGLNINAVYLGVLVPSAATSSLLTLQAQANQSTIYDSTKFRNLAINGNFDFWQRVESNTTTVNTATTTGLYTADMVQFNSTGSTVKNFSIVQSTTVPTQAQSGFVSTYSYLFTAITAISSMATSDAVQPFLWRMEGYDYQRIHGKTMTYGFWFQASVAGTYSFAINNNNFTRAYVTTFTVTSANTWQFVTITVPGDTTTSGYNFTNSAGISVVIAAIAGTTYSTSTLNAWQGTGYVAATTSTNYFATAGATIRIAQFSAVEGAYGFGPTDFIRSGLSISEELRMCQRYYEKSYDIGQILGAITFSGANSYRLPATVPNAATLGPFTMYKVNKRTSPTVTIYNPNTGGSGTLCDADTSGNYSVTTTAGTTTGYGLSNASGGSLGTAANQFIAWHWVADAGL